MTGAAKILFGKVMHKRLAPRVNGFTYGIYYLALNLAHLRDAPIRLNRFGLLSFYEKDHGARDGSDLLGWARAILRRENVPQADGDIILVTMPRVLGYVFNPVSFWLCHDRAGGLRAVLCEVNNTFGESHNYLCAHADRRVLDKADWIAGDKVFHVSPFLQTEGAYRFRFQSEDGFFGAWIDHEDQTGEKKLLTILSGRLETMNQSALRQAFWRYPLVTFKAIGLIHWQAVKLWGKGVRYVPKPPQRRERFSLVSKSSKT